MRALSFAVDVPAGVVGPTATRLDFSMNNAPTFPINDAHAFAAFMRVLAADGLFGHLRALLSLSVQGPEGFFQTSSRHGAQQTHEPVPVPADALLEHRAVPATGRTRR